MRVLALETATPIASAAIVDAQGVAAEATVRAPMRGLEWLAAAVDAMLRDLGLAPEAVDGVAVSQGPGGFTGLRIGIATAAAWARARHVPVVGVGTLEALAVAAGAAGWILPVLDAHRGEVAGALYRILAAVPGPRSVPPGPAAPMPGGAYGPAYPEFAAAPVCAVPPVVGPASALAAEVLAALQGDKNETGRVIIAGDGLARHGAALLGALGERACVAGSHLHPRAAAVGLLGRARLLRGDWDDPAALRPVYGRRPDVRAWQETSGRSGSAPS